MVDRALALAIPAGGVMLIALGAMAAGEPLIAGFCFLSASLLIYLRETRF